MCKTLLKDPILKGYFTKFHDSYGIKVRNDVEESRAFRRFINYTLLRMDTPDIFTGNVDLLDFVCVEFNNVGFDGFGVKLNGHLVQSVDDIVQFVEATDKLSFEFVFIRIGFELRNDEDVYSQFLKDVLSFFSDENKLSKEIESYLEIVNYIYTNDTVARKMDENPMLSLLYVPTKIYIEGTYSRQQEEFQKTITEGTYYFGDVSMRIVNGKSIVSFCKELENKFSVNITYREQLQLALTGIDKITNAISFTCQATELLKLLTKADGTLRRSLFNDNVRDYLGATSVNEEIELTIQENPAMFLLCNNGITIVCSKFDPQKEKGLVIVSPQIVNGCQTCTSIFRLRDSNNLEKVQVQVRLICTDDFEITNQIVRGTNKQNFVLDEAFETLRPFHQKLESYFDLRQKSNSKEVKLYYERRTKQYSNNPIIPRYQIVNLRIITQTFVGMFLGQPHIAHRHEAKLLEIFGTDERQIYCDTHDLRPYFVSAYTWYMFEEFFRVQKIPRKYKVYRAHLYLLFRLSLNKELPSFDVGGDIEGYCEEVMRILTSSQFEEYTDLVVKIFDQAMTIWTTNGGSAYGIKDRKEFTELLLLVAGNRFKGTASTKPLTEWQYGTIIHFAMRERSWIGILKPERGGKSITFGERGFDGEVRKIVPGVRVRYKLRKNSATGLPYADQVKIVQ